MAPESVGLRDFGSRLVTVGAAYPVRVMSGASEAELPSPFVLGAGFETYDAEFERGGIRTVRFVRRASNRWPSGWVVSVDPPVPDPRGGEHTEVVLSPYRSHVVPDLQRIATGQSADVNVGPAAELQDDPNEYTWYIGALAQRPADLPQRRTAAGVEAARLAAFLEWAKAHPERPNPAWDDQADGVPLYGVPDEAKRRQFRGGLDPAVVRELEGLPNWEWWDCDEIDLLDSYLAAGGMTPIPDWALYRGRPVGLYLRSLVARYDGDRVMLMMWESGQIDRRRAVRPNVDTMNRLDGLPWWPEVRGRAKAQETERLKRWAGGPVAPDQ